MRGAIIGAMSLAWATGASAAGVGDFAWMTGVWAMEKDGVTTWETWLPAVAGTMAGVTQTNVPGRAAEVAFATISEEPAGMTFSARAKTKAPTLFVLRPGAGDEAVFENPKQAFPQRIVYRRCDADMCARLEGVVRGEPRALEWRYRREK
jgi:hypothetical protein